MNLDLVNSLYDQIKSEGALLRTIKGKRTKLIGHENVTEKSDLMNEV